MRTTDRDPSPLGPVAGEKVQRPAPVPAPAAPASKPAPRDPYGVVQDADGRFRTTRHP